jgi:phosphopantothenoylcysteine decarboxylase/phosphopantothenate--cysteine ligase
MARILLIVGGGIAAYKSLELVRLLKKAAHEVTPVLTQGGEHFVTAMSLGTLAESPVHTSLWEMKDEVEIGHIQLSRAADFVLVCPASADLIAKMAAGIADNLATTLLLATDKPVVIAPAMNVRMWLHSATRRNVQQLVDDGVQVIEPAEGEMACGDYGPGRLPEPQAIVEWLTANKFLPGK